MTPPPATLASGGQTTLLKRIIPCLDVRDGQVVKGVQFRNHEVVGEILDLAWRYRDQGADELVFYDITASSDGRRVSKDWVARVAENLDIPFSVAGGIRSLDQAREVLNNGAEKISVNSPALERPDLIDELAREFGSQCIVAGVDSRAEDGGYFVYQYTGDETKTVATRRHTMEWLAEVQDRGAGEVVLNCMNQDGARSGYDIPQLQQARAILNIPLVASGGAGELQHFVDVFQQAEVDAALAASVFHKNLLPLTSLKTALRAHGIPVRG